MTRILLIAQDIDDNTFFQEMAVPLGLCHLASYVQKNLDGVSFKIIEGTGLFRPEDYDLIGISTMSLHFPAALSLAERIRKAGPVPVVLGGPHITALPHRLPGAFDAGVIGEGEITFLEIIRILRKEGCLPAGSLQKVNGLCYHNDGKVAVNPPRPLIEDMGTIPFPARALWNMEGRMKQLFTGRGCPCRCRFCALPDRHYRKFPLHHILKEIVEVKDLYQVGALILQDEALTFSRQWLKDLAKALEREGLNRDLAFFVSMRADHIDGDIADILQQMNVKCLFIGMESASDRVLKYLKSGEMTKKHLQKALDLCAERDIQVEGSFIIGSPEESDEDLKETYRFIAHNYQAGKLDLVNIFALLPFPGSGVWEDALKAGLVSEDMDWSRLSSMPVLQFDPEKYIYMNRMMPMKAFLEHVESFKKLMLQIDCRGIARLRKNILDPMKVGEF